MQLTKDYLSKENGNSLKGIFAVVILLHHISQFNYVKMPYYVFLLIQSAGYLAVGIFFALSGYGLSVQVQTKKDYLKTFWMHRILPLYLHYVFFMLLYLLFFIGIGRKFTAVIYVGICLLMKQDKYAHKPTVYQILRLIAQLLCEILICIHTHDNLLCEVTQYSCPFSQMQIPLLHNLDMHLLVPPSHSSKGLEAP